MRWLRQLHPTTNDKSRVNHDTYCYTHANTHTPPPFACYTLDNTTQSGGVGGGGGELPRCLLLTAVSCKKHHICLERAKPRSTEISINYSRKKEARTAAAAPARLSECIHTYCLYRFALFREYAPYEKPFFCWCQYIFPTKPWLNHSRCAAGQEKHKRKIEKEKSGREKSDTYFAGITHEPNKTRDEGVENLDTTRTF